MMIILKFTKNRGFTLTLEDTFLKYLDILGNYLEKTTLNNITLPLVIYETSFFTSTFPLQCKQINRVKSEVHERLPSMLV